MQDPFSQANAVEIQAPDSTNQATNPETTKTVYVPEKPEYILGIEGRTFFGIFYGALIMIIFFSLMEAD